jgi:hypothetical protein
MAEVKNSFLASKMNQDLDDRLIPSNEYREAFNIAISQSEDSDVGAVENIRGTLLLESLGNGEVIGYAVDEAKDNLYLFWTSYTDSSNNRLVNHQASASGSGTDSKVYRYNVGTGNLIVLAEGRWLNFSTTHPIYGVNVLENLLFWTDNRNQPRKINTVRASENTQHYSSEDHVSVAKYSPYQPLRLYKDYSGTYKTTMKDATSPLLPGGASGANPDYNINYAGDPTYLEDKFARLSYRFKFEDGEYSIIAPFTQIVFIPKQDGSFLAGQEDETYKSTVVSFMENKVNFVQAQLPLPAQAQNLASEFKIIEVDILGKESNSNIVSVLDTITVQEIAEVSTSSTVYEYNYQSRKPVKTLPANQAVRVYDKTPVRALSQEVSGNRIIYGNYIDKHTAPDSLNYQVSANQKLSSGSGYDYAKIEYPEHTVKRNRNYQVGFILSDRYGRESDVILSSVVNNNTSNGFGASTIYFPYKSSAAGHSSVKDDIGNSLKIQLNEQIRSTLDPLAPRFEQATGEPGLYDAVTNPLGWYSYKVVVKQTEQEYYNVYLPGIINGYLNGTEDVGKIAHAALIGDNINKIPRELQEVGPDQTLYAADAVLYPVVENQGTGSSIFNQQAYPGTEKYPAVTIADFDQLNKLGQTNNDNHIYSAEDNPLIVRIQTPAPLGETHTNTVEPFLSIVETTPFESNVDIYYETSSTGLISELNTAVINGVGAPAQGLSSLGYTHNESQNYDGSGTDAGANDSPFVTIEFWPRFASGANLYTSSITAFLVEDATGANRTSSFEMTGTGTLTDGYRIKIKENFYYGPNAEVDGLFTFIFAIKNSDDDTSGDVNGLVDGSTTVVLDNITPGKPPFLGMFAYSQGLPAGTTITEIVALDESANTATVTLSESVTLSDGASITLSAPSFFVRANGSLTNVNPSINTVNYPSPLYYDFHSANDSPLIAFTGNNGSSKTADRTKDLSWAIVDLGTEPGVQINKVGSIMSILFPNYAKYNLNTNNGVLWRSQFGYGGGQQEFSVTLTDAGGGVASTNLSFDFRQGAFGVGFSTAFDI